MRAPAVTRSGSSMTQRVEYKKDKTPVVIQDTTCDMPYGVYPVFTSAGR